MICANTFSFLPPFSLSSHSFLCPSPPPPPFLLQLQKAIEGSTRSGVRLRPPLASLREISNHNSVSKAPPSSPNAPSSPTSVPSPSAPGTPQSPHPSPPPPLHHQHHHQQESETEVWVEGVKTESSGGSSSSNSNLTLPPSSTPPPVPSSSTLPPPSPSIPLSTLVALRGLMGEDEDSDDEPMV